MTLISQLGTQRSTWTIQDKSILEVVHLIIDVDAMTANESEAPDFPLD